MAYPRLNKGSWEEPDLLAVTYNRAVLLQVSWIPADGFPFRDGTHLDLYQTAVKATPDLTDL